MSLIFCRQEPVKHPYYIGVLGVHIYFSQKLCYIVYDHPVLVMDDFLDDLLIGFICKDSDMGYLANQMEKLMGTDARPEGVLALFLSGCDYYSDKEIQGFKQTTATLCALHPAQYEKQRADYTFVQRQYGEAAAKYGKVLECPRDKVMEGLFLAKACNNLGACYAMMFQFHKASSYYDKAHELGKDDALLKRIYLLTVFAPELNVKGRYQPVSVDKCKGKWSEEIELAALEAGQTKEVEALWALFKEDPIKRMSDAAKMAHRWKQGYQMMV